MVKIIGILNYNENSFSDGGKYSKYNDAIARVSELFQQGADIVDIGVCSTSYNAPIVTEYEELKKIKPLLNKINCQNVSIDSYNYNTIKYAINSGVKYINDVSGGKDYNVMELIAGTPDIKYICMFSIVLPANKKIRVSSTNEIYDWMGFKIDECKKNGISKERLILDPGIGFTTNASQSIKLLKEIKCLEDFGVEICISHSRKSFFKVISNYQANDRDIETLAASLYLSLFKVDYIRVHNVTMHKRALLVFNTLIG